MNNWFDVDKEGLARIIEKRGKAFTVFELLQNSWDEPCENIKVYLEKIPNCPLALLTVIDDAPEGFIDLTHAYTLFADSKKKSNAELRGRFNLGEKLVLAICDRAELKTTTGSIVFDSSGRKHSKNKTDKGTILELTIRMNQKEYEEVCKAVHTVLPPKDKNTFFNNELIQFRDPLIITTEKLPTEIADDANRLIKTVRKCNIEIYKPYSNEIGFIYEMGIPIVESGIPYHINVMQKVPISFNRDNITPAYRKLLLKTVLNSVYDKLNKEEVDASWISEAAGVDGISKEAVKKVAELQFGSKFVALDPTDKESAEKAQTEGYTVIASRGIPSEQREQLKKFGFLKSSSELFPTPKPFSDDSNAKPAEYIPSSQWTSGMCMISDFISLLSEKLIGKKVITSFVKKMGTAACFDSSSLEITFNYSSLGKKFFEHGASRNVIRLVLHELAHYYSHSHHHENYYKALENLGADLAELIINNHDIVKRFRT